MLHLIKDGHPTADCPFCDKPLHHGDGGITNGLHAECDRQFNEELELHEERIETSVMPLIAEPTEDDYEYAYQSHYGFGSQLGLKRG